MAEKMSKTKKVNILYLCHTFFLAVTAIVAFIFATLPQETIIRNGQLVGALLALSSIPYLFVFVIQDGINNPKKSVYAAFGIIGVVLGVTSFFLETETSTLNTVCLIRGIFDIIRLTMVLTDLIPSILKEKKYIESIEFFVSIGETIIAVFLIIEGIEGARTHFFYMGCAFVILFAKNILEKILEVKKAKNEACIDRN